MTVFGRASMRSVKIILISIITFAFSNAQEDVEDVNMEPQKEVTAIPLLYSSKEECLAFAHISEMFCHSHCDGKYKDGKLSYLNCTLCLMQYEAQTKYCNISTPVSQDYVNRLVGQDTLELASLGKEECLALVEAKIKNAILIVATISREGLS